MTAATIAAVVALLGGLVTIAVTYYNRRNAAADANVAALAAVEKDYAQAIASRDPDRMHLAAMRLRDARTKAKRDPNTGL